ncbi:spaetzle-processing enzyme-like isoform X1 [Drosophila subpulchrella]|uniref:spaetzle-processing enzyme-like isoform X1 n=2 Tax=Drosophila subpulchrella TaxID=1486046 RepID=UPI0018A127EF|nr:spaetzle-processing enzyme-like isoform X1 [Drosophila subpulchrella]
MLFELRVYISFLLQAFLSALVFACQPDEQCVRLDTCYPLMKILRPWGMTTAEREIFHNRQCAIDNRSSVLLHKVRICCPKSGDVLPNNQICGQTPPASHVIAGEEAPLNGFPWIAMLLYANLHSSTRDTVQRCAGSLITNRYVLTAAHCVNINGLQLRSVRLGEHDTSSNPDCVTSMSEKKMCAPPHLEINVELAIKHRHYVAIAGKQYNDIALLRLQFPVRYTSNIRPICIIPSDDFSNPSFDNFNFQIAGWGSSDTQNSSNTLLYANIQGMNPDECSRSYSSLWITKETQICAGGQNGKDTCKGDSGSPLMATMGWGVDEFVYLAGITSYGFNPCGDFPAAYTKTSYYVNWIQRSMSRYEHY